MSEARLGRGWPFPVRPDPGIAYVEGPEKVRQALEIILDTEPGERVMRPEFGCGLRRFLMEPNSPATRALVQQAVQRALARWEPRIRLGVVQVLAHPTEPSRIDIVVPYVLMRTGQPDNLVYPFYLE